MTTQTIARGRCPRGVHCKRTDEELAVQRPLEYLVPV